MDERALAFQCIRLKGATRGRIVGEEISALPNDRAANAKFRYRKSISTNAQF